MKVAISGSHGFIGSAFVKRFTELGYSIVTISQETLYDFDELQKLFIKEQPDYIIHLAAYGNHSMQKQAELMLAANVGCTFNMLEASLSVPYKAFLNFGSSSEYGKKEEAMSESDLPETDSFYGATKIASTYLARAFAKQYDKPIVNIRPFSVYGDGEADFRFIPTVIRSILQGSIFNLDELPTHDWVYIKDFINACLLIADKAKDLQGEWVNIGSGKSYTNKLIVEMIEICLGRKAKYKRLPNLRINDSSIWQADNNKLISLGFRFNYDIADGLAETIKFYKKKYERGVGK